MLSISWKSGITLQPNDLSLELTATIIDHANNVWLQINETKFDEMYSLRMTFIDLFETRFEILRVSAFYRPQKIENWSIFDEATAQNVKSIKNCFGRFLKRRKKFGQLHSLSMTLFGLFETRFEILMVLAFCKPPKNQKLVHIWQRDNPNCKSCQNWFGSFLLNFEKNELPLFSPLKISKAAEATLDGFYVLCCSSVKYGPIFNFLGSVES